MEKICNKINEMADSIIQYWRKHKLIPIFLFFIPIFLIYTFPSFSIKNLLIVIFPWCIFASFLILRWLSYILNIIYRICSYLKNNHARIMGTLFAIFICFMTIIFISLLSLIVSGKLCTHLSLSNWIPDFITSDSFFYTTLKCGISLIIDFIVCIFYWIVFFNHFKDELLHNILNIIFRFLVSIAITFIIGLNPSITKYIEMWCKNTITSPHQDIEELTLLFTSAYNLYVYSIIAWIFCVETTYKIVGNFKKNNSQIHDPE